MIIDVGFGSSMLFYRSIGGFGFLAIGIWRHGGLVVCLCIIGLVRQKMEKGEVCLPILFDSVNGRV